MERRRFLVANGVGFGVALTAASGIVYAASPALTDE